MNATREFVLQIERKLLLLIRRYHELGTGGPGLLDMGAIIDTGSGSLDCGSIV